MPQTVMVVEDDRHICEVICEYLKDAGYITLACDHGGKALEQIEQNDMIDLFILDIMLPAVNGLSLLAAIRESQAHKEKPVIMLTALGDEATQLLSFDALADDYITKPFSPKVMVRRVQALLRRNNGSGKRLCCKNLAIDFESYEAFEDGERIKLTLREFELLGALMQNAGRVLSRQQLLDHAWGYDYFGDDRIVDVHIKNLRKKLRGDPIATVKGVGYKLEGGL